MELVEWVVVAIVLIAIVGVLYTLWRFFTGAGPKPATAVAVNNQQEPADADGKRVGVKLTQNNNPR